MNDYYPENHHTEISRIKDGDEGGWEFVCHSCGYRARYTMDKYGNQKLEILHLGDSSARHTSGLPEQTPWFEPFGEASPEPLDDVGLSPESLLGEPWLPDHVREQIEAILMKFE
jgi:hypothetical protein